MKKLLNLVLGLAIVASLTHCKKEESEKYDDLKVDTEQVEVVLGSTKMVTIQAGSGNYKVFSPDASRVKVNIKANQVMLEGVAIGGPVAIEITDVKTNQKKSVDVTVVYADIELAETKISLSIGKSEKVKIKAGSGFYELIYAKQYTDFVHAHIDKENYLVVTGKASGETTIQVRDQKTQKTADLKVVVGK